MEAIRTKRRGPKGATEYLIKWEGYDSDVNSWEPAENVGEAARSKCPGSQQPVRPPAAPGEASPLARGCFMDPIRAPSPHGCWREAAAALLCLPTHGL